MLFCGGLAPDLHFDIMVQVVRRVAVAVQANVATLNALGVDEFSRVDFDPFFVFADAEPRRVVVVIVENGGSGSGVAAPIARKVLDKYLDEAQLGAKL